MYCNKCGAEIKNEKAQFCGECGAPVKRPKENTKINQKRDGEIKTRSQKVTKRIVIGGCIVVVLIISFLIWSNLLKKSNKDANGNGFLSMDVVSVDNLSAKSMQIYGGNNLYPDYAAPPEKGTVIEAFIKNRSDESLDISLIVEATIEYTDDYEDKQTAHIRINIPPKTANLPNTFHCPYSSYNTEDVSVSTTDGLIPVGLAPKEKKTVYYYFYGGNFTGYDVDNNEKKEIEGGTITDIKLIEVKCRASDCVYVPASEWKDQVELKQENKDEYTTSMLAYFTGEIENNTKDRWERVVLQMDARVNGQGYGKTIRGYGSKVGVGRSCSISDYRQGFSTITGESDYIEYDSDDINKIEFIPALMYYKPEKK